MEKIDRSCVITDLGQASCFWRNTLCSGTLTLAPVGEGVICFFKKVYSGILLGVFFKKLRLCSFSNSLLRYSVGRSKNCWGSAIFPTVYSGILLGG